MKRIMRLTLLSAVLLSAAQAQAAVTTYKADFTISGLTGAFPTLAGDFTFTADLSSNLINDLAPDDVNIAIGSDVYSIGNTTLDVAAAPFSEGARDFIIGRFGAGAGDTNNSFVNSTLADFRLRFNLDSNGGLLVARGGYRPSGGSLTSFDTSLGNGATATFRFAVVPEPASWALMIGGFGLVGAALRRRERQAITA